MDGFTKLAPAIWLLEPPRTTIPATSTPIQPGPSLIVLCLWLQAKPQHIAKYVSEYRRRYPTAALLLLESNLADMMYRGDGAQQDRLGPARHVLLAHTRPTTTGSGHGGGTVLHAFSNGGAQCAAQAIACIPSSQRATAFCALVLDSCPGEASYSRSANAILLPLAKSPVVKLLALPLIHLILCVIFIADRIFGFENVVARARRRLNCSTYVAHDVPRLYIYSIADAMVPAQDVEAHAEEARRLGYKEVTNLRFDESLHCAHASKYGEQYWTAVTALLNQCS